MSLSDHELPYMRGDHMECGHDWDGTSDKYHVDTHYPDRKFLIMQSFCGGGGTARLLFGNDQIARLDAAQLRQLAAEILGLDEKSKTLIEDMKAIMSSVPKEQAQAAIAKRIMAEQPAD